MRRCGTPPCPHGTIPTPHKAQTKCTRYCAGYRSFIHFIHSLLLFHLHGVVNLSLETGHPYKSLLWQVRAEAYISVRRIPISSTFCWKAFSRLQKWKFLWSERGELYWLISENILQIAMCSSDYMIFGINAGACSCLCHLVTDWTRSNSIIWSALAVRKPLLLCCGPFLRSFTSRRSEIGAQRQTDLSGLVWTRSGAHDWGLCTAQLQHKWIFTWLCYPFSFLPNQVSKNLVALSDRNQDFCCEWRALLNVFLRSSVCTLRSSMTVSGAAAHCFVITYS